MESGLLFYAVPSALKKHACIIGASASIAPPLKKVLVSDGWNVTGSYFNNPERTLSASHVLDLKADSSIASFSGFLSDQSPVDCLIFLTGELPGKSLNDYETGQISGTIETNLTGQIKLIQALLPRMNSNSRILMVSSIAGQRGSFDPVYAAAKGGILAFVKSMAATLAPRTTINALAPGLIENSRMYHDMTEETREKHRASTPTGRLLTADDLARIILDLAQPHWAHLNGACIDINGGQFTR